MHVHDSTPQNPNADAAGLRIGVVVSRYHDDITGALRNGAVSAFVDAGGGESDVVVFDAPGSFELTICAAALARRSDIDAVVALGCIITGETTHDQYIAHAVSNGLTQISIETRKPVAFGVLTCRTLEQARARAGGDKGNKGREAMNAAIAAVHALHTIGRDRTDVPPPRRDDVRPPAPAHDPLPRYAGARAMSASPEARSS